MQLSKRGDYGLRVILELALAPRGEFISAATVAERQSIPLAFLGKIANQLAIAGLVRTQRGATGGMMLGRAPADISILDVVQALDGPIILNDCLRARGECTRDAICPVYSAWDQAQAALMHALRSATFDVLADESRRLTGATRRTSAPLTLTV
jgi:Rrf2 family protein